MKTVENYSPSLWPDNQVSGAIAPGTFVYAFRDDTYSSRPGIIDGYTIGKSQNQLCVIVRFIEFGDCLLYPVSEIVLKNKESLVVAVDKSEIIASLYPLSCEVLLLVDGRWRYGRVKTHIRSGKRITSLIVAIPGEEYIVPIADFTNDCRHPRLNRIHNVLYHMSKA